MRAGARRVLAILGLVALAVALALVESVQDALVLRDGTRVQASRARWPRLLEVLRGLT